MIRPSLLAFPKRRWLRDPQTARDIPPAQPSARQDALFPGRGPSDSLYRYFKGVARLPLTARIERVHSDRARSASKKGT